jgi:hypothetical protein
MSTRRKEKNKQSTAVSIHEKEMNHKMDWENSKAILTENNSYKSLIKESSIIKAYQPELQLHNVLID